MNISGGRREFWEGRRKTSEDKIVNSSLITLLKTIIIKTIRNTFFVIEQRLISFLTAARERLGKFRITRKKVDYSIKRRIFV